MLKHLFADPPADDPYGLRSLCQELQTEDLYEEILRVCRPAVEVRLAEFHGELPHTASRLGGHPALPDQFGWPVSGHGEPMVFLAQLTCEELAFHKLPGLPEEGLLSIFFDTLKREPQECQVFYFSLKRDLIRQKHPATSSTDLATFRPIFKTVPSLPRPGNPAFEELDIPAERHPDYFDLLDELEQQRDTDSLQVGGHAPWHTRDSFPEGDWDFLLAVSDIEDLMISWPRRSGALVYLPPRKPRFCGGRTRLSWEECQSDWDDEDWEEEEDDEDEEEEEEE